MESGETPVDALARELVEEIGVVVDAADLEPLIRFEHPYPEFTVRLHAYTASHWQGEPVGAEGQVLGWHDRASLRDLPLLPANWPLLNALGLPSMLRVTPLLTVESAPGFARVLGQAITSSEPGGIVIRVDGRDALARLLERMAPALRYAGRLLILNPGEAIDPPEGFHGLHLPARTLRELNHRPACSALIGASVHTPEEACRAHDLGLDYVIVGNVRSTPSHPDRQPLGWTRFEEIASAAGVPAYAIGGVAPKDLSLVRGHWGQGVAGIRAFWQGMA